MQLFVTTLIISGCLLSLHTNEGSSEAIDAPADPFAQFAQALGTSNEEAKAIVYELLPTMEDQMKLASIAAEQEGNPTSGTLEDLKNMLINGGAVTAEHFDQVMANHGIAADGAGGANQVTTAEGGANPEPGDQGGNSGCMKAGEMAVVGAMGAASLFSTGVWKMSF